LLYLFAKLTVIGLMTAAKKTILPGENATTLVAPAPAGGANAESDVLDAVGNYDSDLALQENGDQANAGGNNFFADFASESTNIQVIVILFIGVITLFVMAVVILIVIVVKLRQSASRY